MTRIMSLLGAVLSVCAIVAAAPAPAAQTENYMRAVPAGPSGGIRCRRVCVKSGRGTPTHPPACVQWRIVC